MTTGIQVNGIIPDMNRVNLRLMVAREDAGLTQPELAREIESSRGTVSNYERGTVTPRRGTLILWALATGVDLHWLETGEAPAPVDGGGASVCAIRDSNPEPADNTLTLVVAA